MKHGNTETIETIEVLLHALLVATVKLGRRIRPHLRHRIAPLRLPG